MSVTAAEGFVAAGVHAGLKANRRDVALLATDDGKPVPAAAVFTTNKFRAPPVEASLERLQASGGMAAGVIVNSGNANAGTGSQGSLLGDVEAQMRLQRQSDSVDAPGVLRVDAVVRRCEDAACNNVTELASADFGTASLGQAVVAQLQWDRVNKRFLFSRDGGEAVSLAYTVPDAGDAHAPFASISVRNTVPNCTTAPRPTSMIDALFDDLALNKSAVP